MFGLQRATDLSELLGAPPEAAAALGELAHQDDELDDALLELDPTTPMDLHVWKSRLYFCPRGFSPRGSPIQVQVRYRRDTREIWAIEVLDFDRGSKGRLGRVPLGSTPVECRDLLGPQNHVGYSGAPGTWHDFWLVGDELYRTQVPTVGEAECTEGDDEAETWTRLPPDDECQRLQLASRARAPAGFDGGVLSTRREVHFTTELERDGVIDALVKRLELIRVERDEYQLDARWPDNRVRLRLSGGHGAYALELSTGADSRRLLKGGPREKSIDLPLDVTWAWIAEHATPRVHQALHGIARVLESR